MQPTMYQICIRGCVTERFGSALEGMRLEAGATESMFVGEIRDQSQLYGLLDRVRDLGLELVSVQQWSAAGPTGAIANGDGESSASPTLIRRMRNEGCDSFRS